MLRGERVGLRARHETDLPILIEELANDVDTRSRADSRPWVPVPPDAKNGPYSVSDLPETAVCFSVVDLAESTLVGEALLWGLDLHNRMAHIGLSLRPLFRGQGLGRDVVSILCSYGFVTRGLNRLQIDTLADNLPMRQTAESLGFRLEGSLHRSAWVVGEFVDEVVYGLLAGEWRSTVAPDT